MSVTLDTPHFERSPLNDDKSMDKSLISNKLPMSVTTDTFQDPIGPCGPLEQSLDSFRDSTMAALSSDSNFGVHPVVRYCYSGHAVGITFKVILITTLRVRIRRAQGEDYGHGLG